MLNRLHGPSAVWLLAGLAIGLGIAMLFQSPSAQATATDHSDDFAIATGHLNTEIEAVYLLDFKTGELLGTVMNRQTGAFQNFYTRKLAADFALNVRAKPKFVMVTGTMQNARAPVPIYHVLYVAELNSGKLGAYYMPYRGEAAGRGTTSEELQLMSVVPFRQTGNIRVQ